MPALDERLLAAARCFKPGDMGADIGADHGRLSMYLLANGICRHMIVSDISEKALAKAKTLLTRHGLDGRATFVTADGFDAINSRVETVAILGMGGRVIAGMLKDVDKLGEAKLVVSAHTGQPELRRALSQVGYVLAGEQVVRSMGRFYTVIEARKGDRSYSPQQMYIGPSLWAEDADELTDYLQWRLDVVSMERGRNTPQHIVWLKEALEHAQGNRSGHL